jgi:hypothetical protein
MVAKVALVIIALVVVTAAGLFVGSYITAYNDASTRPHYYAPTLVYGNVSIGSLGIPKQIAFETPPSYNGNFIPGSNAINSTILMSGNGQYTYQVYLQWPFEYSVTIFFQDSRGSWQYCAAIPGTVAPHGPPQAQNFGC